MKRRTRREFMGPRRNSFGLNFPNVVRRFGTKGDVGTFFMLLEDLIADGVLEDNYKTISQNLYSTLVNQDNYLQFGAEQAALKQAFSKIKSDSIDWERYPYNREFGQFDYQQCKIDPSKPTLADVFASFFEAFDDAASSVASALARFPDEIRYHRIFVSPTDMKSVWEFGDLSDAEFLESADDPLWIREPG